MAQCKATTQSGTRCKRAAASPSKSLCEQHAKTVAAGQRVVNAESGRAFPKPRAR